MNKIRKVIIYECSHCNNNIKVVVIADKNKRYIRMDRPIIVTGRPPYILQTPCPTCKKPLNFFSDYVKKIIKVEKTGDNNE